MCLLIRHFRPPRVRDVLRGMGFARWLLALACMAVLPAQAMPAAGFVISDQAQATYTPASGFGATETVHSNTTLVSVLPVEALTLTNDQSIQVAPGAPVVLPHVLTNTGNTPSSYTLTLTPQPGDGFVFSKLSVVWDRNGNGVVDPGDTTLTPGTPAALTLTPGQAVNLLVVGTLPAGIGTGAAHLQLQASTNATAPVSASNHDTVTLTGYAALHATTTANVTGNVGPGANVSYSVSVTNNGTAAAAPTAGPPTSTTQIRIDGVPTSVVLLRDPIPTGEQYVPGSLTTQIPGAIKVYRLPSDGPFDYRTTGDDPSAIEVGIALPTSLAPGATAAFGFTTQVTSTANGVLSDTAAVDFNDGSSAAEAVSNAVLLNVQQPLVGIAEAASVPVAQLGANGAPDGTEIVTLTYTLENYGQHPLYDLQANDTLAGAAQFGTYTAATVPAAGQYSMVPGSLAIGPVNAGTAFSVNPAFTGTGSAIGMLRPGSTLLPGGTAMVSLQVRFYASNRSDTIENTSNATAAQAPGAAQTAYDDSVNGVNPDPDGDGDPRNNASPTPVVAGLADIALTQTATVPTPSATDPNAFDVNFHVIVRNNGTLPLTNLRVPVNLDCTFLMDQANGPVSSWKLNGPPTVLDGNLVSAGSLYTGHAACNRAALNNTNPVVGIPNEPALDTADGAHTLAPGQQEEIVIPVHFVLSATNAGAPVTFVDKAYAASYNLDSVNAAAVTSAAASAVSVVAADPSGVIYRSSDRSVVSGAVVTLRRLRCSTGSAGPITADQLASGSVAGQFTFNADGSVSMTTGAAGSYQFVLLTPPVSNVCEYSLSVVPPAGLTAPSTALPPTAGDAPGGAVQTQTGAPAQGQRTTYYLNMQLGPGKQAVWNNHIPVDPAAGALFAQLGSNKSQAELGDFVFYTLTVLNRGTTPVTGITVSDLLPTGFEFVSGSAKTVDANGATHPLADPAVSGGANRVFSLPQLTLAAGGQLTIIYRVRIGPGAQGSDGNNRATAQSGTLTSNQAIAHVSITGGTLNDDAILFGKVFLDCNHNGIQDADEPGVPGVRLLLENGTTVVTDVEGKWSLYGLKPTLHVVKVDPGTLPTGATLETLSTRNAGRGDSVFADLDAGELHKANFAIGNCGPGENAAIAEEVQRRRQALQTRPDAEGEAVLKAPFNATVTSTLPQDERSLPISGTVGSGPALQAPTNAASAPSPAATARPANAGDAAPVSGDAVIPAPRAPPAANNTAPAPIPLESEMNDLDNAPGFIGLRDHDVLPAAMATIRVKGAPGEPLRLSVNGTPVPERQVGKKAELAGKRLIAWEYVGVALVEGENHLALEAVDGTGVAQRVELTVIAPGRPARVVVQLPKSGIADAHTQVPVTITLVDAHGTPVTARTQLTLESSVGRWAETDLDPTTPGTQVFIEGGTHEFHLVPPNEPGPAKVRVTTSGGLVQDAQLDFLPEMRPMVGVGLVQGVIDLRRLGTAVLQPPSSRDLFETELSSSLVSSSNGDVSASARTAFYFKGTIKGEYLLTTAYDSDKTTRDRMFRDIQPDQDYPIYGDSSVKSYDAQSTGKFYVRIDKQKSYLLYGDFNTASNSDVRKLTQVSRSMTGAQAHYEGDRVNATVYGSRDSISQQVMEVPANGTSGPFTLNQASSYVANSETVEVLVRDRQQLNNVLSVTPMQRLVDYVIDPNTGELLFTNPVHMFDENENPQFIHITYQVLSGGPAFFTGGADAQVKVTDKIQLGAVYARNDDPTQQTTLDGVTGVAKLGDHGTVSAELAHTDTLASGEGNAGRVEVKVDSDTVKLQAQAMRIGDSFDNPTSYQAKGQTDLNIDGRYKLSDQTALVVKGVSTDDRVNQVQSEDLLFGAEHTLGKGIQLEGGVRVAREAPVTATVPASTTLTTSLTPEPAPGPALASPVDLLTAHAKLTAQPASLPQANGYVEAEQDVSDASKRLLAVGGTYQVAEKTRVYGRYELLSTLGLAYEPGATNRDNQVTFGVESNFLGGHSVYSEYRVADSLEGRESQLASGMRNTWRLDEHWSVSAGVERTAALGGVLGQSAAAVTGSADYTSALMQGGSRTELRRGNGADTVLDTVGIALKLDPAVSVLARSVIQSSWGQGQTRTTQLREQLGLALRPTDRDDWNALARYEYLQQEGSDDNGTVTVTDPTVPSATSTPTGTLPMMGVTRTHVLSAVVNAQPRRDWVLSGRIATKFEIDDLAGDRATSLTQLLFVRALRDFGPHWDAGLQAIAVFGNAGERQTGLGAEVGRLVKDNLWMALGYNAFGLHDNALAGNDDLNRGVYVTLRLKFDEKLFK